MTPMADESAQPGDHVHVVSLNLRQGGGRRVKALRDYLAGTGADVLALQESHPATRRNLVLEALAESGFEHQAIAQSELDEASAVAIASRHPLELVSQPLTAGGRQRVLRTTVAGITLVTAYFPSRRPLIQQFWQEAFLPLAAELAAGPTVLLGDWNSGCRRIDEDRATLSAYREFEALAAAGWTDAWRAAHPQGREYTWFSAHGNGFRLDHAFASRSAVPRILTCEYDHSTRESGASDHSALHITFSRSGPA